MSQWASTGFGGRTTSSRRRPAFVHDASDSIRRACDDAGLTLPRKVRAALERGPPPSLRRRLLSRRVRVRDGSMRPTLLPGDRLLLDPAAYRRARPRVGDLVVLVDPEDRRRLLVKRVGATERMPVPGPVTPGDPDEVPDGRLFVVADAPDGGRDSRRFGTVSVDEVRGQVWFRYAPADRAGPVE